MIDPDRPLRDQDPLDQNARSGAEGSGVGAWDLDLSTGNLNWSTATRKLFGVGPDAPVDYDLFLSLLDSQDRDRTARRRTRTWLKTTGSLSGRSRFDLLNSE